MPFKGDRDIDGDRGGGFGGGGGGGFGGGGGGNRSGNGLGLTTGKTWHGNTAYGPAGGMARGYATRSGGMNVSGPSVSSYSNFRNLDGSAAIPGAGGMSAMGRNPQQARAAIEQQLAARRPRVGGLLDGEQVVQRPIGQPTQVVPVAGTVPTPSLSFSYNMTPPVGHSYGSYFTNPTDDPVRRVHRTYANVQQIGNNGSLVSRGSPGGFKANGELGSGWQDRVPRGR